MENNGLPEGRGVIEARERFNPRASSFGGLRQKVPPAGMEGKPSDLLAARALADYFSSVVK